MGIQANGPLQLGVAFLIASHHPKAHSEPMVRDGISGIQLNRTLKFLLRRTGVIVVMEGRPGQRSVGLRQAVVEFECFQSQPFGLAATLFWRKQAPQANYRDGIGQTCIGEQRSDLWRSPVEGTGRPVRALPGYA